VRTFLSKLNDNDSNKIVITWQTEELAECS